MDDTRIEPVENRLRQAPAATRCDATDDRAEACRLAGWPAWRRRLFLLMSAASVPAAEYFRLPPHRTIEI